MGNKFTDGIIRQVEKFRARTQSLKERSDYYPIVLIEEEPDEDEEYSFVASTLLRKEHEGTWYTIHHVQRYSCKEMNKHRAQEVATTHLLIRMSLVIYNSLHLYRITGRMEDVDELQISEEERLRSLIPKRKEA